jgi:lipoate-protein ligase B
LPAEAVLLPATSGFRVFRPGRINYREGQDLQEFLLGRRAGLDHDLLILLEHDPVVTAGRGACPHHLIQTPQQLALAGIDYVETRRGGDVTFHGPGQLVGYPLLDLAICHHDLHFYLRRLEQLLISTLFEFGLAGCALPGKTGVWIEDRKIASIGVAVRHWISWHGFALNVGKDLSGFDTIVPCGLHDVQMTSMTAELQREIDLDTVSGCIIGQFSETFGLPYLGEFDMGKAR